MSASSDAVLICEGYDDRAFLKGWLLRLGASEPARDGAGFARPGGGRFAPGEFGLMGSSGRVVVIKPRGRDANDHLDRPKEVWTLVQDIAAKGGYSDIVAVVDSDEPVEEGREPVPATPPLDALRNAARTEPSGRTATRADGVRVHAIVWECADPSHPLLPAQQSLERIVCAALAEAHPDRARQVAEWARDKAAPPHKCAAWSHYAGWFSDGGTGAFYGRVWQDEAVAEGLLRRLSWNGGDGILRTLIG